MRDVSYLALMMPIILETWIVRERRWDDITFCVDFL
jgi:hypothetical protein